MFPPMDSLLEYWTKLRYSTGEFHALQLIVFVAFGGVD